LEFAAAVKLRSTALHAIVIGRVLDAAVSERTAALAYWQGRYVAFDQDEDAVKLAEVSVPARKT